MSNKVGRPKNPKHEKVEEYIEVFPKKMGHIYSSLKIYCVYRGITIDELLENGKKELKYFKQYLEASANDKEYANRRAKVSCLSQFLRWNGVEIPKYDRSKSKKTYFTNHEDEEIFEDYLESFSGDSTSTVQAAKRCLKKYMDYRQMTLEEIKIEGNTKQPDEIKRILRKYRDAMKETGVKFYFKAYVSHVIRFYEAICYKRIQIRNKTNGDDPVYNNTATIDKPIIRQLLDGADERDKMIILALWDTGLNPSDLCNITYGEIKHCLNLDLEEKLNKDRFTDTLSYQSSAIIYTRQKTNKPYVAVFGWQSLQAISRWMKIRRDGLLGNAPQELKDDTPIFSQKRFPFQQVTPHQLTRVIRVRSELCGFKKPNHFKPSHFRNTYANKLKSQLPQDDFKLLFGHDIGVIRNYLDLKEQLPRLQALYEEFYGLFNLERPDEKYESIKKEHQKLRLENQDLREELRDVKLVVDKLWTSFNLSLEEQVKMKEEEK